MGCGNVSDASDSRPVERKSTNYSPDANRKNIKKVTSKKADWKFSSANFVQEADQLRKNYFIYEDRIGEGGFGACYKAKHKLTGEMRAIKVIKKKYCDQMETQQLLNEVQIVKNLDHPNIVNINEFYEGKSQFFIIMDYYQGGELFDQIINKIDMGKPFNEFETANIIKQTLGALNYCHKNNVVHRDLKPENIMFETKEYKNIKVIDWGTSRSFNPEYRMKKLVGTPYYLAPEVLSRKYDEKCDVWSIGVITFIIISGCPPFNGRNDNVIIEKIKSGKFEFSQSVWDHISQDCKDFISYLLTHNPADRPNAQEALSHKWFNQVNETKIDQPLHQEALKNLKSFHATQKLQKATWSYLVSMLASKKDKEGLNTIFNSIDTNNDGTLTKEELLSGWNNAFESHITDQEIETIFDNIDTNQNGKIDYSEFIMATIDRQNLLNNERLKKVFDLFDKVSELIFSPYSFQDGSGTIDAKELKAIFQGQSDDQQVSSKVWKDLIKEADLSEDNELDLKEFIDLMKQLK